eukprot:5127435-Amphidinium_carterae.1
MALAWAADSCKGDREIVLQAVSRNPKALQWAARSCRVDRDIVGVAVSRDGSALEWAGECCRNDPEIALSAVLQNDCAILWVGDDLLEDESFAKRAKRSWFILKVSLLSGRSCCCPVSVNFQSTQAVLRECCARLGLTYNGGERLVYEHDTVPLDAPISSWPGQPRCGHVTGYQLVATSTMSVDS